MLTDVWQMSGWFDENDSSYWTISPDYLNGSVHMYAIFMTLGVIVAIFASGVKIARKGISLNGLYIASIPIVFLSLFGASFFGKMPIGVPFWQCFAFWHGGMSIHGGVLFGALSGILIFYLIGRKPRVSVWVYMDAIIPNILLGQAIGRWGNFFNHELVGEPVAIAGQHNIFSWMPNFILNNTTFQYIGFTRQFNNMTLEAGQYYQMTPIFIIESLSLLGAWIVITIFIPGIGRWISKKPWKLNDEFIVDWKYSFMKPFSKIKGPKGYAYWEVWNRAFYSSTDINAINDYVNEMEKLNDDFKKYLKYKKNSEIKGDISNFNENIIKLSFFKYRYRCGKLLYKANNPNNYRIPYSGIETGVYFFLWNIVRFSLEYIRPSDVLFISYKRNLSLTLVSLASLIGVVIILMCIFVCPFFQRKQDFVFEKNYFLANTSKDIKIYKLKEIKNI